MPVVCSLQDEEQWVDCMEEPYRSQVWDMIREKIQNVEGFIAVSEYYTSLMKEKLAIPGEKLFTVYPGIDPDKFELSARPFDPPVIGYMARLAASQGLGNLIEAFMLLKKEEQFRNVKLHINGGQTGDDVDFIDSIKKKTSEHGVRDDILFFDRFGEKDRKEFLKHITVMCVPCLQGESFGLFQIEAMAAGVPVVQPEAGAYPEIIQATGGGVTYTPDSPQDLADKLSAVLKDPELVKSLGDSGYNAVRDTFKLKLSAEKTVEVYEKIVDNLDTSSKT